MHDHIGRVDGESGAAGEDRVGAEDGGERLSDEFTVVSAVGGRDHAVRGDQGRAAHRVHVPRDCDDEPDLTRTSSQISIYYL